MTSSTTGMTQAPRPIAMAYSKKDTLVNSKAAASRGISQTTVVAMREPMAASQSRMFRL